MSELIFMGIFLSIVVGLIFCYIIILIKRRSLVKNAIKKIKKQNMMYRVGGKEIKNAGDIFPSAPIEKEVIEKKDVAPSKTTKIPKPTTTKTKKKIKKRKYPSTLKAYQKKKGKKK